MTVLVLPLIFVFTALTVLAITSRVSLFQFLGYCLLVISAIVALRVLALVFRPNRA